MIAPLPARDFVPGIAALPAALTAVRRPRNPDLIAALALLPLLAIALVLVHWGDRSIVPALFVLGAMVSLPYGLLSVVQPTRRTQWPSLASLGAYVFCQGALVAWRAGQPRLWPLAIASALGAPAGLLVVHRVVLPPLPLSPQLLASRRAVNRLRRRLRRRRESEAMRTLYTAALLRYGEDLLAWATEESHADAPALGALHEACALVRLDGASAAPRSRRAVDALATAIAAVEQGVLLQE